MYSLTRKQKNKYLWIFVHQVCIIASYNVLWKILHLLQGHTTNCMKKRSQEELITHFKRMGCKKSWKVECMKFIDNFLPTLQLRGHFLWLLRKCSTQKQQMQTQSFKATSTLNTWVLNQPLLSMGGEKMIHQDSTISVYITHNLYWW